MEIIKPIPTEASPLDRAAYFVGGRGALALMLGVSVAAIGNWKVRGVPIEHCVPIEKATNGVVGRRELRPTDCLEIWPELAVVQTDQSANISNQVIAGALLTADPALQADLVKAEQVGIVKLPKQDKPWDGAERRHHVRRADDRKRLDIVGAGQGV